MAKAVNGGLRDHAMRKSKVINAVVTYTSPKDEVRLTFC